jgi:hypothetical protein
LTRGARSRTCAGPGVRRTATTRPAMERIISSSRCPGWPRPAAIALRGNAPDAGAPGLLLCALGSSSGRIPRFPVRVGRAYRIRGAHSGVGRPGRVRRSCCCLARLPAWVRPARVLGRVAAVGAGIPWFSSCGSATVDADVPHGGRRDRALPVVVPETGVSGSWVSAIGGAGCGCAAVAGPRPQRGRTRPGVDARRDRRPGARPSGAVRTAGRCRFPVRSGHRRTRVGSGCRPGATTAGFNR